MLDAPRHTIDPPTIITKVYISGFKAGLIDGVLERLIWIVSRRSKFITCVFVSYYVYCTCEDQNKAEHCINYILSIINIVMVYSDHTSATCAAA